MMLSHSPEQAAIATQLLAQLDAYGQELLALVERRWDPELSRSLSDRFDRIELYVPALPQAAATWTEFLISRVELVQALWTVSSPSRIGGKLHGYYAQHRAQLGELRRCCEQYV